MDGGVFCDHKQKLYRADGIAHYFTLSEDSGPNKSRLTLDEIHQLLNLRIKYKFAKDFGKDEQVARQLNEAGVFVDIPRKEYRYDGVMHDYKLFRDAGPNNSTLKTSEIHELLQQRLADKKAREFFKADQIIKRLFDAGVFVNDSLRQWRADGNMHPFKEDLKAGPNNSILSHKEINAGLSQYHLAQLGNNFVRAGKIREKLSQLGVFINDKMMLWRADGVRHDYKRIGDKMNNSALSKEEIHTKLSESVKALLERDFHQVDTIVAECWENGVFVDPRARVYQFDGDFSETQKESIALLQNRVHDSVVNSSSGPELELPTKSSSQKSVVHAAPDESKSAPHLYQLAKDSEINVSMVSMEEIQNLLVELSNVAQFHQEKANELKRELGDLGVYIDDERKQWRADGVQFDDASLKSEFPPAEESVETRKKPTQKPSRTYTGVTDHPYKQAEDADVNVSMLSDTEIQEYLARLGNAVNDGKIDEANELKIELQELGVILDEQNSRWRADGCAF
jgi:post-segregation antitoxin (ccd killing protein)